jgi:hypothetical protein
MTLEVSDIQNYLTNYEDEMQFSPKFRRFTDNKDSELKSGDTVKSSESELFKAIDWQDKDKKNNIELDSRDKSENEDTVN